MLPKSSPYTVYSTKEHETQEAQSIVDTPAGRLFYANILCVIVTLEILPLSIHK